MPLADILTWVLAVGGITGLGLIIWKYARGLRSSPRDLWLIYLYKIIETAAYSLTIPIMILSIKRDSGLHDVSASNYMLWFSILASVFTIAAGAFTDTIGIKKMTIISIVILFFARVNMAFVDSPILLFILGYAPLAAGLAIVAPVVSVAVKKYTNKDSVAMGFALYYIAMNLGFAIGGHFVDEIRDWLALKNEAGAAINENYGINLLGHHFSTYKFIFLLSCIATILSIIAISKIRDPKKTAEPASDKPLELKSPFLTTWQTFKACATERFFWVYLVLVGLIMFVQSVNRHFHLTFPDYGLRVLGEGAKIGSVYGVLNPVLIIFLVPTIAALTKHVSSYKLMLFGSLLSVVSCFIAAIPGSMFSWLSHTVVGELVLVKWLHLAPDLAHLPTDGRFDMYWPLFFFIGIFTIGEAIWSPRFYQFAAEIAPKGKEATYMSLAVLPTVACKLIVNLMSGHLLATYVPVSGKEVLPHPDHSMVWVWIGVCAALTPVGLLISSRWFHKESARQQTLNGEPAEEAAPVGTKA